MCVVEARTLLLGFCLILVLCGLVVEQVQAGANIHHKYERLRRKPNIVLILTDDQDVELGSLNFMPHTMKLIRDEGAEFRHAYVTTPMCCPSRSSLLTGMYVHNHNVYTNNDNCSSTQWQMTHETRTFARYLSDVGYRTGYFGKYLNKYNGSYVPPGWREWGGLIMNSKYYNYTINMNGKKIKHGFDYAKDYYPDLIANDSIAFLRQSKKNSANKPVMLTMSFPAPHGPEDSAPQFSHMFFNVTTHHTPSYDYAPNPDKQWILQRTQKMLPIHREFTDLLMTKRLQTLQSVDHAVKRVYDELDMLGELDNTYIIYTSDHGYHLGQYGLIKGKSFPFEFDVRVPFLVRGPGVKPGSTVDHIVLNIDLAPTFLEMAGYQMKPPHMDGKSIMKLLTHPKGKSFRWPDTFLIESSGRREVPSSNKGTDQSVLLTTEPSTEPFDMVQTESTPLWFETTTLAANAETDSSHSSQEDDELDDDVGDDDDIVLDEDENGQNEYGDRAGDPDNGLTPQVVHYAKQERITRECQDPSLQHPCRSDQKWYCIKERGGRWRKHKCKFQLDPLQKKVNCACFTSEGPQYEKVPIEAMETLRRQKKKMFDKELTEDLRNQLHYHQAFARNRDTRRRKRYKRSAIEEVETSMKHIRTRLTGLQAINASLPHPANVNLETNRIMETAPGCVLMPSGHVNCSASIYNDRKTWRRSRLKIETEIHELELRLDELKEIRKHLKHSKPHQELRSMNTNNSNRRKDIPIYKPIGQFDDDYNDTEEEVFAHRNAHQHHHQHSNNNNHHQNNHHQQQQGAFGDRRRVKPLDSSRHRADWDVNPTSTKKPAGKYELHNRRHYHAEDAEEEERSPPYPHNQNKVKPSATPSRTISKEHFIESSNGHVLGESSLLSRNQQFFYKNRTCLCDGDNIARRLKEERQKRKQKKLRKKAMLAENQCFREKMNCFIHDNDHWKTAPLWTSGQFCFCMNANNNTYSCLRTINATHNFLYCEFVTGLMTFYDLKTDPFALQNAAVKLELDKRRHLHDQLQAMLACKGETCNVDSVRRARQPKLSAGRRTDAYLDDYAPPVAAKYVSSRERIHSSIHEQPDGISPDFSPMEIPTNR